jgi:hypothetical protein
LGLYLTAPTCRFVFADAVADHAGWQPAQHPEGVDVAFQECFLTAGGEDFSPHY